MPTSRIIDCPGIGDGKVYTTEFDSVYDVARYISNQPVSKNTQGRMVSSDRSSDPEWSGTSSLAKALTLMIDGYSEPMKVIKEALDKADVELDLLQSRMKLVRKYNVAGAVVSVPRHLALRPDSMIEIRRKTLRDRMVTIVYDVSAPWFTSHEDFLNAGINVMKLCQWLDKLGYRTKINVTHVAKYDGKYVDNHRETDYYMSSVIKVKDFTEYLAPENLCFLSIHPSSLRRIEFALAERSEHLKAPDTGYGRSIGNSDSDSSILREKLRETNEWFIGLQQAARWKTTEMMLKELAECGYLENGENNG